MLKISITAIVLSGGLSSRMHGQDKGLLCLKGKPLYQHVIDKIHPQVSNIMISCNKNEALYLQSGWPIFNDDMPNYLGPLGGIYSGLLNSKSEWNLFVSCDTPFLPENLVYRLQQHLGHHQAAYVFDGERHHPTILLISNKVIDSLKCYLDQGDRKLLLFLATIEAIEVDFSEQKTCFVNINTPEQLAYWDQQP